MSIKDYEFFNGVVLNKLIRKGKPVKIDVFPKFFKVILLQ